MLRFLFGILLLAIAASLVQEVVITNHRGVRVAHSVTHQQKTRIPHPESPQLRNARGRAAPPLTRSTYSVVHSINYPKAFLALALAGSGIVLLVCGVRTHRPILSAPGQP